MKVQKLKSSIARYLMLTPFIAVALRFCMLALYAPSGSVSLAAQCGSGSTAVQTSIDFGCNGSSPNGIVDLLFAIIRFLSAGVGLVVIASIIVGGIQYIVSRGDPNATGAAIKRLTSSVIALIIFIFAYAILNYVIPGGFFHG